MGVFDWASNSRMTHIQQLLVPPFTDCNCCYTNIQVSGRKVSWEPL